MRNLAARLVLLVAALFLLAISPFAFLFAVAGAWVAGEPVGLTARRAMLHFREIAHDWGDALAHPNMTGTPRGF